MALDNSFYEPIKRDWQSTDFDEGLAYLCDLEKKWNGVFLPQADLSGCDSYDLRRDLRKMQEVLEDIQGDLLKFGKDCGLD